MKKNGFIATSLIYSFFLIFITLFLTVIVDYIQNKVNLEYQESSVKAKLNSVLTAKDFEPGDYVLFDPDCNGVAEAVGEEYIVAAVYYKNALCGNATYDCVILYSYDLIDSSSNAVTAEDINTHIDISNKNATTVNEIVYTFNTCGNIGTISNSCRSTDGPEKDSYYIPASGSYDASYPTLSFDATRIEDLTNKNFTTKKGYLHSSGNGLYRTKKILVFNPSDNDTKNRESCKGSSKGTYYLKRTVTEG